MSLNASQQWWIRTDGDESNGGGYDATVSGAGTNYSDQAAAQLSLTDLACLNNTTLTSATGGFTTAMIGNVIRIASGTNFTPGYYMVTARASTNSVTLDSNPTNGSNASAGVGKLGGAWATFLNLAASSTGGVVTGTVIAPLAPGHTINVRGTGSLDGATDYDFSSFGGGIQDWPSGGTSSDGATVPVYVTGYNGRPNIGIDTRFNRGGGIVWRHLKFTMLAVSNFDQGDGVLFCGNPVGLENFGAAIYDCIFDQNGFDTPLLHGGYIIRGCIFKNSGSTAAGSKHAIKTEFDGSAFWWPAQIIEGNVFQDLRCGALWAYRIPIIFNRNIVKNCHGADGAVNYAGLHQDVFKFDGNVFYGGASDGIKAYSTGGRQSALTYTDITNSIFMNNGGYGINFVGQVDPMLFGRSNAFYGNTSGQCSVSMANIEGTVTLTGDPFTNAAGGDFSLNNTTGAGAACRAAGFPSLMPDGVNTSYLDIGPLQHLVAVVLAFGAKIIFRNSNYV